MNEILHLKGHFEQKANTSKPSFSNLPKGKSVDVGHLVELRKQLIKVKDYWEKDEILEQPLVSVYYSEVVAKSNRIKGLLTKGSKKANSTIVGAKFKDDGLIKHIITHCVSMEIIQESIIRLEKSIDLLNKDFNGCITHDNIEQINKKIKKFNDSKISKSVFINVIVDCHYVEKFGIEFETQEINEAAIITIYKMGINTKELMKKLNIDFLDVRSIDDTTLLLSPEQYLLLQQKAPYLIAMAVSDLSELTKDDFYSQPSTVFSIPKPGNEPTIGVIDTLFFEDVYFSDWVEYVNMVDRSIPLTSNDYEHGTKVTSIIVDGPSFNPDLEDGCGRFKVRHFGVATSGQFSSFTVLRAIKEIIANNKDIKVWNLSLGSAMEINDNFISPEAAVLDQIQYENDVIFVVAGTNKSNKSKKKQKIGAPADSINSLVVNAVDFNNKPASYSREGLVLSFFNKPDVCYYGGDITKRLRACSPTGESMVIGTSYAAPWISRKMAYLIHVLGFSREVAKALIIDSAAGWMQNEDPSQIIGYGVVPKHIEDIIQTSDDEIRFILTGVSEKFDTYNYNIPIPIHKDKQPFIAKATLCYFPKCSRSQGVDYTNTELDLHFGRINGTKIKSINNNKQSTDSPYNLREGNARTFFRKWDNVKHINERLKKSPKPKKAYGTGLWGISIKTKERLDGKDGEGISFGVVVTLKEINGINRIEEFIQQCSFRGWLVNRINVLNRVEIYQKAEEDIVFDEYF